MDVYHQVDPREEKLPRWAQENMKFLRARVAVVENRLKEIETGTVPSNFWFESVDGGKYYKPRCSRLMFSDGSGDSAIDIGCREGWPGIYLNSHRSLIIKPSAANACYVKSER